MIFFNYSEQINNGNFYFDFALQERFTTKEDKNFVVKLHKIFI